MSIQSLKINLAEWLLLKFKYRPNFISERERMGRGLQRQEKDHFDAAPVHDNLGDHAIAYASKNFLNGSIPILTLSRWI